MDSKKKPDPKDLKKQLEAQAQVETLKPDPGDAQAKHAKQARGAQVHEPTEPQGPMSSPEDSEKAVGDGTEGAGQKDATKTPSAESDAKDAAHAQEVVETKDAKEAKEAPLTEQASKAEGPEAKETAKADGQGEEKAAEGEKKAAEAGKKAAEGEQKAGAEGKGATEKGEAKVEQKAAGGGEDLIRWTPTEANNASVQSPAPPSLQQSETILNAAQTAADASPVVSPQTASQPAAAQPGWASKAVGFAAGTLRSAFVGNFALWDPNVRDGLHKAFADWSDVTKAKGIDRLPPILDHVYRIVDSILNFTSPLGTVLGIVSYARYIPIPPIPAIGSALYVVSQVLKAINFVLEIVRAVVALMRPIVSFLFVVLTKDPERRRKYQERLSSDLVDFATSGFSVVMSAGMGGKFLKGFREARKGGMSVLGSLGKGAGGASAAFRTKWKDSISIIGDVGKRGVRGSNLYKKTLDEAYKNAMAWRLYQRTATSKSGKTYTFKDIQRTKKPEYFERLPRSVQTHPGFTSRLPEGSTVFDSYSKGARGTVFESVVKGNQWDRGRVLEVGGSAFQDAVKATVKKVHGQAGKEVKKGLQGAGQGPAPQAGPPCVPQVQAAVDQGGKATEQSLKDNQTPLLKDSPVPPKETPSAPAHLEGIKAQQEVMKTLSKAAEEQVLSAKAGQEEGKAIMKVAQEHGKGAAHAQQEAASHQQGLQKEQQDAQKGRQKAQEGQKQQQKGKGGFGKVESEGSRAKGAVPGGRVNRDDIPWYRRIYLWVVDKFEGAKAKVTQAMTGVVMKAVEGAAGFGDVDQKMQEANQQTQQQEQVLSQEPAVVQKVQSVAQKEAQAATEGEQKGAQRVAENQKAEAAGQQVLQETKKQEAALQKEEQQVQSDAAKYEGTYGKSFDTLNKHADASQAGDLTPLEIRLNQEIAALQDAVSKLLAAIAQHHGQVDAAIGENVSKFREAAAQAKGEQGAQAVAQAESLGAQFRGQAAQTRAERAQKAEGLARDAQAYGGKAADAQAIEAVSKLLGEALGQARQFDQEKQSELDEMHQAFTQQYQALFQ